MQSNINELLATAHKWMELDPDNAELLSTEIIAAEDDESWAITALTARFAGYLTFGTAGLRAPLGPGTTRMKRVVVRREAAGIADFALQHTTSPVIISGHDARHYSREFAQDSAAVFTAAGCRVKIMPNTVPTQLLAFAIQRYEADVGIVVTSSHYQPSVHGST